MTNWTFFEDIVACHIYAVENIAKDKEKAKQLKECALRILPRNENALKFKIANIEYVVTGEKGFENKAEMDELAWKSYSAFNKNQKETLEAAILSCYPEIKDLLLRDGVPIRGEDVIRECKVRIGQAKLRERCLELAGGRCMVTGIRGPELLVASHIKPWRDCTAEEKTDVRNVLCLSPFYDALFDKHLMTVYPDMSIRYSPKIHECMDEQEYARFIAPYVKLEVNERNRPDDRYLKIHNEEFEKMLKSEK